METIVYGICTCKRDGCIGCHPPLPVVIISQPELVKK